MKHLTSLAIVLTLIIGLANVSFGQINATATSDAKAKIASGISLENNSALNFGTIVRTPAGGTVTLSAAGEVTYKGVYKGQNTTTSVAGFDVAGEPDYTYGITLPSSIKLTREGGNESMLVDDFVNSAAGTLSNLGEESFSVGATLHVNPSQATGVYSGSFDVTVQYQ